uniref:Uncharacterized protein n=1 Tax=Alteromonadaceae bacterium PE-TB08W TaxID=1199097 RepID=A0A3G9EEX9_9ALTE|nr:hypothetical protein [Alteromonadaceae bacterium PE-TB08W]
MPIYQIYCELCDRTFQGTTLQGLKAPERWVCSQCGCDAKLMDDKPAAAHPLENIHHKGCPCCG